MDALKAEQIGTTKWRVLAIPFGGPFKGGKDFDGEFFSAKTDIKPRWFRERPVIFHHGMDDAVKDADLGVQELDDDATAEGWWGTIWLDRSARYWEQVNSLLRAGKMYGSSGAIAHLVRKDHKTGEILVWPHAEQTITPTPANPFSRLEASKAIEVYTSAGIAIPDDLRADLSVGGERASADLPTGGDAAAIRRNAALAKAARLAAWAEVIRRS